MFVKHRQNHCCSPPINWNNHTYLVSQHLASECSVQAKNACLSYGSTRVTCRNTLLNNSDDWRFVSHTCFHYQYYCISLCVQLVMQYAKWKKPLECKFWNILSAYFTTLMNSKNFKNGIMRFYTTHAKYLHNKLGINFSMSPSLKQFILWYLTSFKN